MYSTVKYGLVVILGLASVCPGADTWIYKTEIPTPRGVVSGCTLDGRIYVIGGAPTASSTTRATETYDPQTDSWTTMADMPAARCGHATCTVDGKIYVLGGISPDVYSTAKSSVFAYDPKADTWHQKADMPYPIALCGVAAVDGIIYVIGGSLGVSSPPVATVMAYDPVADVWFQKADIPTARFWLSACAVHGKIYAVGGCTENWQTFSYKHVEVYDPATDTWTRASDMPTARFGLGTCVVGGKICAVGGHLPSGATTANEIYDPAMDTWKLSTPLQHKRLGQVLQAVGGKIYAIGGSYPNPGPSILASVEEYDLTPPPPDFNGDGLVDMIDLLRVVESWNQDDPLADIAPQPFGDGIVDAQDLELLMSYWQQEVDDHTLIAHWALDESEGTTASDSKGISDGYAFGDPVWKPDGGHMGGAISLDGIDDHIVATTALNPAGGPFSIFAWVQGGAPGQTVISQFNGDNWLRAAPNSGCLMTELCASGRGGVPLLSAANITDGSWHRAGFVWDGTYRVIYVDDLPVAEDTQNGLEGSTGGLKIGGGTSFAAGTFWSGMIDDVRIYNRAVRP